MMMRSVSKSDWPVPPRLIEKKTRSDVPKMDANQKEIPGCFLFLSTARIAVTSGITAEITATWAEVVRWRAIAIKIGQPKTAPNAVKMVGLIKWRGSLGTFSKIINGIAKSDAMTGRAKAVKSGSKLLSASLVKGRESEKAKTPIKAKRRPLRCFFVSEVATSLV